MRNLLLSATTATLLLFGTTTYAAVINSGTLSYLSEFSQDFNHVYNGRHSGIQCHTNSACTIQSSITLPLGGYQKSSDIVLSGFNYQGSAGFDDTTGRVKVVVEKTNYNETTGQFTWNTTLHFDMGKSTTFSFDYDFSILLTNGSSLALKRVSNSCSSASASCVSPALTVTDAQPLLNGQTTTLRGWAIRGFEAYTTSGQKSLFGQLRIDPGLPANVFGQPTSKKQTLNCTFGVYDVNFNEEPIACAVETVAIADVGGHGGFEQSDRPWAFSYPTQPNSQFQTQTPSPGFDVRGFTTPLASFDLAWAVEPLSLNNLSAGCFDTTFNFGAWQGETTVRGYLARTSGAPTDHFVGDIRCLGLFGLIALP